MTPFPSQKSFVNERDVDGLGRRENDAHLASRFIEENDERLALLVRELQVQGRGSKGIERTMARRIRCSSKASGTVAFECIPLIALRKLDAREVQNACVLTPTTNPPTVECSLEGHRRIETTRSLRGLRTLRDQRGIERLRLPVIVADLQDLAVAASRYGDPNPRDMPCKRSGDRSHGKKFSVDRTMTVNARR